MYFGTHAESYTDFRPDALAAVKAGETFYQQAERSLGKSRSVKIFPAIGELDRVEIKYGTIRGDPETNSLICRNVVLFVDLKGLIRSVKSDESCEADIPKREK